jgi:hypothetical protein
VLFSKEALSCVVAIGKKEERERERDQFVVKNTECFFLGKEFFGYFLFPS